MRLTSITFLLSLRQGIIRLNDFCTDSEPENCNLIVDKTGTLTEGKPKLVSVVAVEGVDENALPQAAASLEKASEHPLAAAILAGAKERKPELNSIEGFESVTGKGVKVDRVTSPVSEVLNPFPRGATLICIVHDLIAYNSMEAG